MVCWYGRTRTFIFHLMLPVCRYMSSMVNNPDETLSVSVHMCVCVGSCMLACMCVFCVCVCVCVCVRTHVHEVKWSQILFSNELLSRQVMLGCRR